MPRLPQSPNLEHLRKQAKALLPELQRRNPAARLADAQYAIAREYGFASWPKLKAHIEAASAGSPFRGEWIVNPAQSRRRPSNGRQATSIHFAVDGDVLVITYWLVNENGRERINEDIVRADGISSKPNNGFAITASWRGSHVLEVITTRNGAEIGQSRFEVATDRRTMTISGAEQVIVLDRTER